MYTRKCLKAMDSSPIVSQDYLQQCMITFNPMDKRYDCHTNKRNVQKGEEIEVLQNHAVTLVNSHVSKVLPFQLFMTFIVLIIIAFKQL